MSLLSAMIFEQVFCNANQSEKFNNSTVPHGMYTLEVVSSVAQVQSC